MSPGPGVVHLSPTVGQRVELLNHHVVDSDILLHAQPRGGINKTAVGIRIRIDIWALLNPNPDPEAMKMKKIHERKIYDLPYIV